MVILIRKCYLDDDDTHSESTSGCSSLLPHTESKQEDKEKREAAQGRLPNQRTESLHESLMDKSRGRKTLNLNNYSLLDNLGITSEDKASKMNGIKFLKHQNLWKLN